MSKLIRFSFATLLCGSLGAFLLLAGVRATAQSPTVVQIDLDDVIHPISAEFVREGLKHAAEIHADAVLLRLNTPGGLEESMRDIVEDILGSPVPVVAWVGPGGSRAASAGFFILLSADVSAMAPGTNTGAAHPVLITGGDIPETMEKKVVNDAAAFLRSYSSKRGRNPTLAEKAVTDSASFSDAEALKGNLCEVVAKDVPELLSRIDGRKIVRFDGVSQTLSVAGASVVRFEMSMRQRVLSELLNPNIAFLLAAFGVIGLYVEFTHPGFILPGVAGGISLILALFAFNLLPISMTGVLLLLLAIVLFVMEATITSHGILAAGGIVSMVAGGLMLVQGPIPELRIQLSTVVAVALPFALITVFLLRLVLVSRKHKPATGDDWLVGRKAISLTPIHKTGKVEVSGEIWNAWSRTSIGEGMPVRVVTVNGLNLEVQAESEENV